MFTEPEKEEKEGKIYSLRDWYIGLKIAGSWLVVFWLGFGFGLWVGWIGRIGR